MYIIKAVTKESLKKPGLNGIRTNDLCDTGAVLDQLSYQARLELLILVQHCRSQRSWIRIALKSGFFRFYFVTA